jgi:hypothetical protein
MLALIVVLDKPCVLIALQGSDLVADHHPEGVAPELAKHGLVKPLGDASEVHVKDQNSE